MNKEHHVNVTISSDEYRAYMTIKPDPDVPLSLMELGPLLKERGVVSGIKKDVLMNIVDQYRQGSFIDNTLVAEGTPPFAGVEPSVEYKFEMSAQPGEDEISTVLNVETGRLLAVKRRLKPPVNGMTVTGKRTMFPQIEDIDVKIGQNIEKDEQDDFIYYKAGADGVLRFEDNVMSIFPTLKIEEDVNAKVGNIHFNGDVRIGRDVPAGFVVEADGKITIRGSAIACNLSAKQGVEVRIGIVGKNKGAVYSGKDITALFVENTKMKAAGNIIIGNGIIGSEVECDGELKMEMSRSRVVGSTIRAARGITVGNAGSRYDASTRLITGIDPARENVYLKIKKHLEGKVKEAKELESRHGRPVQKTKDDITRWESLKKEIQLIYRRLKKAEEEMFDNNAVIRVKETLYPRATVIIGKHRLTVSKKYYRVTVRYSREEDRLVIK
jgi:uncharacterized protein (DUF342 family)